MWFTQRRTVQMMVMLIDAELANISGIVLISLSSLLAIMFAMLTFTAQTLYAAWREIEETVSDCSHKLYKLFLEHKMIAKSLYGDEFYKSYGEGIAWLSTDDWKNITDESEYISKMKIEREMQIVHDREAKGVQLTLKQLEFENTFHKIGLRINFAIYRLLLTRQLNRIINNGRLFCIWLGVAALLSLVTTIITRTSTIDGIPDGYNLLVVSLLFLLSIVAFGWLVTISFKVIGLSSKFQQISEK